MCDAAEAFASAADFRLFRTAPRNASFSTSPLQSLRERRAYDPGLFAVYQIDVELRSDSGAPPFCSAPEVGLEVEHHAVIAPIELPDEVPRILRVDVDRHEIVSEAECYSVVETVVRADRRVAQTSVGVSDVQAENLDRAA